MLTLAQSILAIADTSAFAEMTFSLVRRLKSNCDLGILDYMFYAIGLMF